MKRNTNVKENEMSGSDKSERNMSEKMKGLEGWFQGERKSS